MYIVAVAWLYVALMMAITETTVVAGVLTFSPMGWDRWHSCCISSAPGAGDAGARRWKPWQRGRTIRRRAMGRLRHERRPRPRRSVRQPDQRSHAPGHAVPAIRIKPFAIGNRAGIAAIDLRAACAGQSGTRKRI